MFMRHLLRRALEQDSRLAIAGEAHDGCEAVEKNAELKPDVVLMDVEMPKLDGLGALAQIMSQRPVPVVMFSSLTTRGAQVTLEALSLGAVDFLPKPESRINITPVADELCHKIVAAASARLRKPVARTPRRPRELRPQTAPASGRNPNEAFKQAKAVVVIGSSTGGPQALDEVLPRLPEDFPGSVLVVQHMPAGFTASMAKRLDSIGQLAVREATDGDVLVPGRALVAPGGFHMRVTKDHDGDEEPRIHLDSSDPVHGVRPAIDVTLLDAAPIFCDRLMVVILTGMGFDGARGARTAKGLGATVVCQDESTSVVWGMPRAAIELGASDSVLPLPKIAAAIERFAGKVEERD